MLIATREIVLHFCEDETSRCLVVPENLKIDSVIPSKLPKGKILLLIKLRSRVLKMENIFTDVRKKPTLKISTIRRWI